MSEQANEAACQPNTKKQLEKGLFVACQKKNNVEDRKTECLTICRHIKWLLLLWPVINFVSSLASIVKSFFHLLQWSLFLKKKYVLLLFRCALFCVVFFIISVILYSIQFYFTIWFRLLFRLFLCVCVQFLLYRNKRSISSTERKNKSELIYEIKTFPQFTIYDFIGCKFHLDTHLFGSSGTQSMWLIVFECFFLLLLFLLLLVCRCCLSQCINRIHRRNKHIFGYA